MYKQSVCLADSHWDKIIGDFFQIFGNHLDSQQNIQKKEVYQGKPPVISAPSQSHFSCFFSLWLANLAWLPCAHCTTLSLLSRPGVERKMEKLIGWWASWAAGGEPASPWSQPPAVWASVLWCLEHLLSLFHWPAGLFHNVLTSSLLLLLCNTFLPLPKYVFPEVPPAWVMGSAVSCGGLLHSQLEPAVPDMGHPWPLLTETTPPAANTCMYKPSTSRY